ncbi:uncharacterized protein [Rhodnius prolixus]|uniref:uncharacterized protein n=1 Tax=Rhodnius prolixus TaxID=13249 RepID=UPI003D18A400
MTMSGAECFVRVQADLSEKFMPNKGLRQGDALACLLFNLALEKAVRDSGIQASGTLLNKTAQLLAFADGIDIIAKSMNAVIEAFLALEMEARRLGLVVNEAKTKYVPTGYSSTVQEQQLKIAHYKFETVKEFGYLGSLVSSENQESLEIKRRIMAANRCYFGLVKYI